MHLLQNQINIAVSLFRLESYNAVQSVGSAPTCKIQQVEKYASIILTYLMLMAIQSISSQMSFHFQ